DILTKSLHPGPFHTLLSKLGVIDIFSSLRGTVKEVSISQVYALCALMLLFSASLCLTMEASFYILHGIRASTGVLPSLILFLILTNYSSWYSASCTFSFLQFFHLVLVLLCLFTMSVDSTAASINHAPPVPQNKGYQNDTLNP
ncbi:hypothetical protein L195_g041214, partial [Trifolium pratense]